MPARLLIVDDESSVVELLRRYLARLGHSVDTALNARQALTAFERAQGAYDLVIADLQLPDLNGEEMVRQMRSGRPSLKALISSGHPSPNAASADPSMRQMFIQKPFLPQELADRIGEILTSPESK